MMPNIFTWIKQRKEKIKMALTKQKTSSIVKKYGKSEKDTGSIEVQVALLTEKIKALTEHMKVHSHDYSSKRGLDIIVGKRKGLLEYLKHNDHEAYLALIKKLGLRR